MRHTALEWRGATEDAIGTGDIARALGLVAGGACHSAVREGQHVLRVLA